MKFSAKGNFLHGVGIAENLDHIGDLFTANTFAHELGHNIGME